MREFLIMFGAQFVQYFLAAFNIRVCAQGNYTGTLVSDGLIAANGFMLTKLIVESKSKWGLAGYITGGMIGAQVGILVTKILFHQ